MKLSFIPRHSPALLLSTVALFVSAAAHAQTLTIISGQGQIVSNGSVAPQPLTVQLLDASGKPFPNQFVTFADTLGGTAGRINGSPLPTDANGYTSVQFVGADLRGSGLNFVQTQVIATYGTSTVTFTETTGAVSSGSGSLVQAVRISPQQGEVLSGAAGSTGTTPIRILVGTITSNAGIAGVSVSISVDSGSGPGTLSCKEGPFVLTDATGTAVCTPVFGKVGTGTFSINVGGGQFIFALNQFSVSVGPPGLITVTSGDNQSGVPGQRLALPVVAIVSDLAGNILTGAQVVFESVTPGGVTFTNSITTSDANGRVSTNVVLGNIAGPVQIRIRDAGNQVPNPALVTATVAITISGLTKVSGDNQTAPIGAQFALPLVVRATTTSGQASGVVNFTVTSGLASVSPSSASVAADGTASTTVTAGAGAGAVVITATSGAFSQTFNLSVNLPGPTNFTYSNGASFVTNSLSPGSIVTIGAQGLLSSNVQGIAGGTFVGALPYIVAGVSVTIDNIPAPIFYVNSQNGQQTVTVQVPFEVRATTVPISISVAGGGSNSAFVTILPVSPGLFEALGPDGRRRVVALRPNGTVVTPSNPAGRGENIRVYMTGLGAVNAPVPTGTFSSATTDSVVTSNLVAGINNNGVTIVQAIYARNLIGVYELTVTVPTDTTAFPSGTVNFSVAVQGPSGYVYSNSSLIAIQ